MPSGTQSLKIAGAIFFLAFSTSALRGDDIPATPADVQVKAESISENRSKELLPGEFMSSDNSLRLSLQVAGKSVEHASAYGKVKITKAVDDAGDDLSPSKPTFTFGNNDDMTSINANQVKIRQDMHMAGIEVDLDLKNSSRKATKITQVSGTFVVRGGGSDQSVMVKDIPSMSGKMVEDPALKAAGVTLKLKSAAAQATTIEAEVTGPASAIRDLQVLDGKGDNIVVGSGSMSMGGVSQNQYTLSAPIDAAMTLRITLVTGEKETTVPFDLKDIELP